MLPIASPLSLAELRIAAREQLLPALVATALQRVRLPQGMRFVFGATARRLRQLYAVVQREQHACTVLDFRIDVSPGGGALVLDITGPAGTGELLESLLDLPRAA
jgi:hypothetical protein